MIDYTISPLALAHVLYSSVQSSMGKRHSRQNITAPAKMQHLTAGKSEYVTAPLIEESPVNIECRVTQVLELGSHHMFVAEVLGVDVDEAYLDEKGKFQLNKAGLMVYSHGEYFGLGKKLGKFGYSVRKKKQR